MEGFIWRKNNFLYVYEKVKVLQMNSIVSILDNTQDEIGGSAKK